MDRPHTAVACLQASQTHTQNDKKQIKRHSSKTIKRQSKGNHNTIKRQSTETKMQSKTNKRLSKDNRIKVTIHIMPKQTTNIQSKYNRKPLIRQQHNQKTITQSKDNQGQPQNLVTASRQVRNTRGPSKHYLKLHKHTQRPRPHTSTNKETTGTIVFERFAISVAAMAPQS